MSKYRSKLIALCMKLAGVSSKTTGLTNVTSGFRSATRMIKHQNFCEVREMKSFSATNMKNDSPVKLIVDVDAGVDDAMALLLLLSADVQKDIEILGITCSHGNTHVNNVCINVLRLLEAVGRSDIPVYRGAEGPLIVCNDKNAEKFENFHGLDGFGDVEFSHTPSMKLIQSENAVPALNRIVSGPDCKGKVRLVCLAPLTNIALTMKTYADFSSNLKDIYVMGGNSTGVGNITSSGEFNFYSDPEAAHIVLTSACCPIYLLPWETCLTVDISMEWRFSILGAIQNSHMELLNAVEKKVWEKSSYTTWISCDAILAAAVLYPEIVIKSQKCHATVELHGTHTRGQVVLDHLQVKKPNVHIIEKVDTSALKKILLWAAEHAHLEHERSKI
ncbi:hypothetical protein B7P43_G10998 [Cryptotermes secundus]|uniref:Inosine/uridine-preferring nucleoside hydrolase domain-containing protein n=1 Tax=Cryptotermes secundus TaxID=105785 RepID=A0A2J7RMK0_9NEOP|nr:hypothetical protein B7P43_G10998 [Cryptotermes secundus]